MPAANDPEMTVLRLDAVTLGVLAHPLRSRLLSALRRGGPATATELAQALGTNSGVTSYHLRKLALVNLVADTGEGEGKRRLWRAATDFHQWAASDFVGDEDAETALNWLARDYSRQLGQQLECWLDVEGAWPIAWRDATGISESLVTVTAEQAATLQADLDEVVARYRTAGQDRPDAQRVAVFTVLFPANLDEIPDR